MFDGDDRWIWAVLAVVGGLVVGALVGWYLRRVFGRQRAELQAVAGPASSFVFWLSVAGGIVLATGMTSPETLRPIPRDIFEWLPNVLIAGLLILAGYAVGIGIAATVERAVERATGRAHDTVERLIRWLVVGGAAILALGQLGVRTTVLTVIVAGMVFGVAATAALLAGLGGHHVAAHIAASRSLRGELREGDRLLADGVDGVITELHATTVVVVAESGRRVVVPYGVLLERPFEIEPRGR